MMAKIAASAERERGAIRALSDFAAYYQSASDPKQYTQPPQDNPFP
jgi:hypothetical protein